MKPTILTPAILMTAALLGTTAAYAQSDAAAKAYPPGPSAQAYPPGPSAQAWPPGPTAQAYPPGPTGQAAAQTTNVNVVNIPTVAVGNVVTIQEPVREPLYMQVHVPILAPQTQSNVVDMIAPAGKRMVVETANLSCGSGTAQSAGVWIYRPDLWDPVVTIIPPSMVSGSTLLSGQAVPVHLLVDDALRVITFRTNGTGFTDCAVTLIGYLTPLP